MLLVEDTYSLSRSFPSEERYGLTAQMRRAAVSIPSNIAEGWRRKRNAPYVNHLEIALGSQGELDVQLELAYRLQYCPAGAYDNVRDRLDRVGRMLNGLLSSVRSSK